ncbi:MAG: outer membrane protein assembly factor BamD [Alphaproteobacteria bacterium]|nr:outer membrane protein assembly factor BamD [Alphaproteobacteria bacterium]
MRYFPLIALSLLALAACSSDSKEDPNLQVEKPVEVLYNSAADALDAKQYEEASRLFNEVERQHPYSQWATKAQLMSAYAAYQDDRYDEAILALDRFIELHPGADDIDYAFYLKALSYYEQISDVARDQALTKYALEALDTLILRFPDSDYTRDAKIKRDLTLDHLAGKEMEIGRYYLNRKQTNAAINRFRTVIKDYQTTTHTPEALHRLVEGYMLLGLKAEAARVAAVLGHNFPGSSWYQDSYAILDPELREQLVKDKSFVDRTIEGLFKPD